LTPFLARSVGFLPVFFPPEGCFGHAPVHAQPGPIDPLQTVVFQQSGLPHLEEDPVLNPLLKAVMGGGPRTEKGGIERFPGAASAEHEEDGVHAHPIRRAGLAAAEAVRIHMLREQPVDLGPQVVGDAPSLGAFQVHFVHRIVPLPRVSSSENKVSCTGEL
jgi:hypothetical protein